MSTVLAFASTALIVLAVQGARWLVRRRRADAPGWRTWMTSVEAWGAGWPIALVVALYVASILIVEALLR